MKRTRVCSLLGIDLPILQAGLPWVSNPELVAAVSNAGGLGILHPTAGINDDDDLVGKPAGKYPPGPTPDPKSFWGLLFTFPIPQLPTSLKRPLSKAFTSP